MKIRDRDENGVGQDAFLDTTANLVGILIILVVVIGTKTKIDAVEYGKLKAKEESNANLEVPALAVGALRQSLVEQRTQMAEYAMETEFRRQERDRLLNRVALARETVKSKLGAADETKRQLVNRKFEVDQLRSELKQIQQQTEQAEQKKRPKIILEHLPTPMAKTVFTKEMHVQLKGGKVTVIPWDRLVHTLKTQAPLALQRNTSRNALEDTLGPVNGFLMHYRMQSVPGGFELERFELEATSSAPSETLQESLSPIGRLRLELASRDPSETVVTVWVYPDSFQQYRGLQSRIFEDGFLSAARPLPQDVRIGASPHGTRSSAQ